MDLCEQEPGKTFIVADSDLSDLVTLADRISAIQDGRIVLDGPPAALLRDHFDELVDMRVRVPDYVRVLHYLHKAFPSEDEVPWTPASSDIDV